MYDLTPLSEYAKNRALTEQSVVKLGIDICTALEDSIIGNTTHRNLCPERIFVDPQGNFVLSDNEVSSEVSVSFTAPEALTEITYTETADIYSLGLIMSSLLNNVTGTSPELANLISFACNPDPKKRFKSVKALKNALITYSSHYAAAEIPPTVPSVPSPPQETKQKKGKGKTVLLISIIALLCIFIAAGIFICIKDPFGWFNKVIEEHEDIKQTEKPAEEPTPTDDGVLTLEDLNGRWASEVDITQYIGYIVEDTKSEFPDATYRFDPSSVQPIHILWNINDEGARNEFIADEAIDLTKNVAKVMLDCMLSSRTVRSVLSSSDIERMYDQLDNVTIQDFTDNGNEVTITEGIFITTDTTEYTVSIEGNTVTIANDEERFILQYENDILKVIDYETLQPNEDDEDEIYNSDILIGLEFRRLSDEELDEWKSSYSSYTEEDIGSGSTPSQQGGNYLPL